MYIANWGHYEKFIDDVRKAVCSVIEKLVLQLQLPHRGKLGFPKAFHCDCMHNVKVESLLLLAHMGIART